MGPARPTSFPYEFLLVFYLYSSCYFLKYLGDDCINVLPTRACGHEVPVDDPEKTLSWSDSEMHEVPADDHDEDIE